MARKETDQGSQIQELVKCLVQRIESVEKLSDLELSGELIHPGTGKLIRLAEEFAKAKREEEKLKPTQLRRVFHDLKRMEQELRRGKQKFNPTQLMMSIAELAYARGRGVIPQPFYELMKTLLLKVKDASDFTRLMEFLTTLIAYHKFHEKVKEAKGGEE